MDTLNQGSSRIYITLFFFVVVSCGDNVKKSSLFDDVINKFEYKKIYTSAEDSLKLYNLNKLGNYNFLNAGNWFLDSLFCFNKDKNRFITSILYTNSNTKSAEHDGMQFLYGEKINNDWYFFKGASIHIPRSMIKDHPANKPLNYQQLHQIALKEVYGGYLKADGSINEEWFISQFEGNDWGNFNNQEDDDWCFKGKRYTNKKEYYQACHLCKVKANWYGVKKDTIKKENVLP